MQDMNYDPVMLRNILNDIENGDGAYSFDEENDKPSPMSAHVSHLINKSYLEFDESTRYITGLTQSGMEYLDELNAEAGTIKTSEGFKPFDIDAEFAREIALQKCIEHMETCIKEASSSGAFFINIPGVMWEVADIGGFAKLRNIMAEILDAGGFSHSWNGKSLLVSWLDMKEEDSPFNESPAPAEPAPPAAAVQHPAPMQAAPAMRQNDAGIIKGLI